MISRRLGVSLAVSILQVQVLQGLELRLSRGGAAAEGEAPEIEILATSDPNGEVRKLRQGFGQVSLDLHGDRIWTIRAIAEGYWSAPIPMRGDAESLSISLWPAVRLVGSLTWPRGGDAPEKLKVRFDSASPDAARPAPAGEEYCQLLDESRRFVCDIPAGLYDLRARAQGFVSIYLWNRNLHPGAKVDLGELALEPGSSVAGFVETEDRGPLSETAWVELRPPVLGRDKDPTQKLERLAQKVRPNEKGFFHFAGVAEGLYSLRATQEGYSEAVVEGVSVAFGYEMRLRDPLVLTPPRELRLQISPERDSLGESWRLALIQARREGLAPAGESHADDLGFATFTGLSSGKYYLQIFENLAERSLHLHELNLEQPSTFVEIDLPFVAVRGEIRLGEDPIMATLLFGGSYSTTASELHSDEDGLFQGLLPREGEWQIDIECNDPPIYRTVRKVEVKRKKGQDTAQVSLRLPDLRLRGRAVDETSRPLKAQIRYRPEGEEHDISAFWTEDDGSFEVFGMPPGRVYLDAWTKEMESDEVAIDLVEGLEPPFVELVARKRKGVQGMVLSDEGPVPGATVNLHVWGALSHKVEEATTDSQGNFEASLASTAKIVHALILAPGYGYLLERREIPDDNILLFEVDRVWGEIEILYPEEKLDWVQIGRAGASINLLSWLLWARLHVEEGAVETGRALVPRLAAGGYVACISEPGSPGWLSLLTMGQNLPRDRCVTVDLPPSGRQTVDLTDEEHEGRDGVPGTEN